MTTNPAHAEAELRVFVSFSGRDVVVAEFVRALLIHLREQPRLWAWMYETRSEQIPPGVDILEHCRHQLDRADLCLAVVCESCFESPWTREEVEYALSLGRDDFVVPVVTTRSKKWPAAYGDLDGTRNLVRVNDLAALPKDRLQALVSQAVEKVCARLNLPYLPPGSSPRMPLRSRVWEECWQVPAVDDEFRGRCLERLFEACKKFDAAYARQDYAQALYTIRDLLELFDEFFPGAHVYYPKIVEAIVRLETSARDRTALSVLRAELLGMVTSNEVQIDANLYGLLGQIELKLGITHEVPGEMDLALAHFRTAVEYFRTGFVMLSTADPAAIYNLLLSALLAGERADIQSASQALQPLLGGAAVTEPGDLAKLHILKAFAACVLGDAWDGVSNLMRLGAGGHVTSDTFSLVHRAIDTLWGDARRRRRKEFLVEGATCARYALALAEKFSPVARSHFPKEWYPLIHRAVNLQLELGLFEEALAGVRNALRDPVAIGSLLPLIDATIICHATALEAERVGDESRSSALHAEARGWLDRAKNVPKTAVASQIQPMDEPDFCYARGLARWLACDDRTADMLYCDAGGAGYAAPYSKRYAWVVRRKLCRCPD